MGASFWAVADADIGAAREAAQWMAARAWAMRGELVGRLPNVEQAVAHARQAAKHPVVLLDVGDNVGGGSPGDSTILLAEILRQQAPSSLVILYDPAAVDQCAAAGVGSTVRLEVGAKTDTLHGRPAAIEGVVRCLHDGRFEEREVRHGGWGLNNQGLTAVVETAEQHTIILTSRRMAPFSLQQVLSVGVAPERKSLIVVKGVIAPRAAYDPIAAETLLVDTPGVTADSPHGFAYKRRRKPLFPLETEAGYGAVQTTPPRS
jgi:microcystin degradation protein MlrC